MDDSFFDRTLTCPDQARLQGLVSRSPANHQALTELLDAAEIVDSANIHSSVCTMRSKVLLAENTSRQGVEVRLAYPEEADASAGRISVTSPLGLALIGRSIGDIVKWNGPGGNETQATLKAILFQPEAAGDLLS